jgi:hypothetical protein
MVHSTPSCPAASAPSLTIATWAFAIKDHGMRVNKSSHNSWFAKVGLNPTCCWSWSGAVRGWCGRPGMDMVQDGPKPIHHTVHGKIRCPIYFARDCRFGIGRIRRVVRIRCDVRVETNWIALRLKDRVETKGSRRDYLHRVETTYIALTLLTSRWHYLHRVESKGLRWD